MKRSFAFRCSALCLIASFSAALGVLPLQAQSLWVQQMLDSVSEASLTAHIQALAHAGGHQSRVSYTPGNDSAAAYILRTFEAMPGLASVERDTFTVPVATAPYNTMPLANIVATLPGVTDPAKHIILGAHYDCSASRMGNSVWNSQWSTIKAPGADDNATGVAVVIELARILSDPFRNFLPGYTITFVAFGAEESTPPYAGKTTHAGSRHYAGAAKSRGDQIVGMMSIDMIGYNPDTLYLNIVANESSQTFGSAVTAANSLYQVGLVTNTAPFASATFSDHDQFWSNGYPAICLIENNPPWTSTQFYTASPYYHTSSDEFATLNMPLVRKVAQAVLAAVVAEAQVTLVSAPQMAAGEMPSLFSLHQNYPNPFNPTTILRYDLPVPSHVRLEIFDVLGKSIRTLRDGVEQAGTREAFWRADVPSGMYLLRFEAVAITDPAIHFTDVRKMMVLR